MKKLLCMICIMALLVSVSNFAAYATEAIPSELASETESVESVETNETETQSTVEWETFIDSENRLFPAVITIIPIEGSPEEYERYQAEIEAKMIAQRKKTGPPVPWYKKSNPIEHEKYFSIELQEKIMKVLNEAASREVLETQSETPVIAIDSVGNIISEKKVELTLEELAEIATIWYESIDDMGEYWSDLEVRLGYTIYEEEYDLYRFIFLPSKDYTGNPNYRGAMEIVVRSNGELERIGN